MCQGQINLSPGSQRDLTARSRALLSNTHTSRELEPRVFAGHRFFRCQILVLSKIWAQHAKVPWKPACAHMFSFFLAFIFEIGQWILRLRVQRVSGCHISSCGICMFGWHKQAPHHKTMQNHFIGQVKTKMSDCGRWCAPRSPAHAHATTWNVTPGHTLISQP